MSVLAPQFREEGDGLGPLVLGGEHCDATQQVVTVVDAVVKGGPVALSHAVTFFASSIL